MSCCIGIYQKFIHSSVANEDYAEIDERTIPFLQEIIGAIHLMVRSLSQVQSTFSVSGIFNRLSIHIRIQKSKIN